MKSFFSVVFAWVVSTQAFGIPTVFESLQEQFSKAQAPQVKMAIGPWSGYCVHSHDPNQKWPALYVHKAQIDPATNLESFTQTYYWEKKDEANYFSSFTSQTLNSYQPYVEWTRKEQWQPTRIVGDALTNGFDLPNGGTIIRSVRVSETEFNQTYFLEVSRKNSKGMEVLSQCAFNKALPKSISNPNTPTVSIQTGPLSNTYTEIKMPLQNRKMDRLVIQKPKGELVFLSRVEIVSEEGQVLYFEPLNFSSGDAVALTPKAPIRVYSVKFYVEGAVSNLWIYGLTSPSRHLPEALVQ